MKKYLIYIALFIFVTGLIVLTSCREEIDHIPKRIYIDHSSNLPDKWEWALISDSLEDLYQCIEFNGNLIVSGSFELESGLIYIAKYDGKKYDYFLKENFFGDGIFMLKQIDNKLWMGGDFYYYDLKLLFNAINLMSYDGIKVEAFECGNTYYSGVTNIVKHNNSLVATGDFRKADDAPTDYIVEIINGKMYGFSTPTDLEINSSEVFNGNLIVTGEMNIVSNIDLVAQWDGIQWNSMKVEAKMPFDEASTVINYNNELYLIMKKSYNDYFIHKWDGADWIGYPEVSIISSVTKCRLVESKNELFLVGEGLLIDKNPVSNILKLNIQTDKWEPIGKLRRHVTDVEWFQNELYATSTNGLYKYMK